MTTTRNHKRRQRARRVRASITGSVTRPRVSVFRSLTGFSAQVIDDGAGATVASSSTKGLGISNSVEGAAKVGADLVQKCKDAGVETVVFDRAGYKYHGKVKACAEALREGGITL